MRRSPTRRSTTAASAVSHACGSSIPSRRRMGVHEIPLERRTLHGYFSSALAPVLAVDPGDSVTFQALNAGWRWDANADHPDAPAPGPLRGHALNGPIAVRGARAGQTLVVRIDEVRPGPWGV